MPSEESSILCVSRKWPSAARPANFCAYRMVPSFVADLVMTLLRLMAPAPDFSRVRRRWEPAIANRLEEFYDMASLFRGRKSLPRAACCKISARRAIDVRQDRRWPCLRVLPGNGGKFVVVG